MDSMSLVTNSVDSPFVERQPFRAEGHHHGLPSAIRDHEITVSLTDHEETDLAVENRTRIIGVNLQRKFINLFLQ